MALPIAPTPRLDVKATKKFLNMVERGLEEPMNPIPTLKIDNAIKKVIADARRKV